MSEALDRLSKIVDREEFEKWYDALYFDEIVSDIQEVVALAKSKQQPSIDAMRFEAAKAAMQGIILNTGKLDSLDFVTCLKIADALIAELQKTTP